MSEGEIHHQLKILGMHWLKTKGQDAIGIEIKYRNMYSIADIASVNLKRKEVRIIECKASKQDFKRDKKLLSYNNSYYSHCHYFYIMCPENIILPSDIPSKYGLLWVDKYDNIIVKQKPIKNTSRLKTLFNTSLKNICRGETNTLLYYFDNQKNKDVTNGQFERNSIIDFTSIKCPYCKHVTKELIDKNTKEIKCKNCKKQIDVLNAKKRIITGFNKTFINKIIKLFNKQ